MKGSIFDGLSAFVVVFMWVIGLGLTSYMLQNGTLVDFVDDYQMSLDTYNSVVAYVVLLKSNLAFLVYTLILVVVLTNAQTTTQPLYFGASAMVLFVVIYMFANSFIPLLTGMEILDEYIGIDLISFLEGTWYYLIISGLFGAVISYIRGAQTRALFPS